MPIKLAPSTDTDALANAIQTASDTGQVLQLLAGTHLTKPGLRLQIPIGPNGLVMTSLKPNPLKQLAVIQRPDHSIGVNPPGRTDDNYGIFLIPSAPAKEEIAGIRWATHQPASGQPFEYGSSFAATSRSAALRLTATWAIRGWRDCQSRRWSTARCWRFRDLHTKRRTGRKGKRAECLLDSTP